MSLEKEIEDIKAQIAENLAKEEGAAEVVEEVKEPEPEVKEVEPAAETEVKAEAEPKAEEPKAEEVKPVKTASEYARERREKASKEAVLQSALAQAEARIAALEEAAKPKPVVDAMPDKDEDPVAYFEWKTRQQEKQLAEQAKKLESIERSAEETKLELIQKEKKQAALNELISYEDKVKKNIPDYEEAKRYYAQAIAMGIKVLAPNITNEQLLEVVNERLLVRASQLANMGYENPVEAMYEEAKSYGYVRQAPKEAQPAKPDLAKVAAHRARNAGMAGASGRSYEGDLTPATAVNMTAGEWSKLSPEQKKAVFAQMRGA